jgi:ankyrin repeat protein
MENPHMFVKTLLGISCVAVMSAAAADLRLADVAMHGDRSAVRSLLDQKADVNAAQGDGMTALHWAALKNDLEMAQMLLRAGASVKAETRVDAVTPLYLAGTNGNPAMIEALLKAGADVNSANGSGTSALMAASSAGSPDAVQVLLDHGADVNRTESARGQTALMFAAALNRAAAIKILAAHGAALNLSSKVVKLEKARFDEDGNPLPAPPRTASGNGGNTLNTGAAAATVLGGMTALLYAARDGKMEAVQALVEAGADVNAVNAGDSSSPIVIAAANGHYDVAKYLLDHGANPNLANIDGLAPLYATIDCQWAPVAWQPTPITGEEKTSYLELMAALLEKGADPNARINKPLWFRPVDHNQMWVRPGGSTAFWRAAQATDLAAMKLLVAHGADPKMQSANKDTALAMAAGVGWAGNFSTNAPGNQFMASVKYLVEDMGIDVNAQDSSGYTAVMGAAYRGDNKMVQYLASKGARLDARTGRGWSVTDMANGPSLRSSVPLSHPDTVALLIQLGAPPLTKVEGEEILGIIKRKVPVPGQETTQPKETPKKDR